MIKGPSTRKLIETAVAAAHASGKVLIKHFGKKLRVEEKVGAGLVTNADWESENAAIRILKARARGFADFGVLTEESGLHAARNEGRWIMDPLDGTTNYVHRFPMFCVSIAAEWKGEVLVGVIHHPILKETYIAIRGKGASVNGKKLSVSNTRKIVNSLLSTGFSYNSQSSRSEGLLRTEMHSFENLSSVARAIRRPGSAALDLAYTARGVFDGFWERKLSPWDVAAGMLLVSEAGGKVTDFEGRPFQLTAPEILASNGHLHPELLKKVKT
jgi:myo-inositol-1(or 4)-monophosphatase